MRFKFFVITIHSLIIHKLCQSCISWPKIINRTQFNLTQSLIHIILVVKFSEQELTILLMYKDAEIAARVRQAAMRAVLWDRRKPKIDDKEKGRVGYFKLPRAKRKKKRPVKTYRTKEKRKRRTQNGRRHAPWQN